MSASIVRRPRTLEELTQELMLRKGISWHEARSILGRRGAAVRKARALRRPMQYGGKASIVPYRGAKVVRTAEMLAPANLTREALARAAMRAKLLRPRADIDGCGEVGAIVWFACALLLVILMVWLASAGGPR